MFSFEHGPALGYSCLGVCTLRTLHTYLATYCRVSTYLTTRTCWPTHIILLAIDIGLCHTQATNLHAPTIDTRLCQTQVIFLHTHTDYSLTFLWLHCTIIQVYFGLNIILHTEGCHTQTLARTSLIHFRVFYAQVSRLPT